MGNKQQKEQQKEQQKPPKSNSRIYKLSNDLLHHGNLKPSKLFGKRIYVCYIPQKKQPLKLDSVVYDIQISNGIATYNMIQSYKNNSDEPADVEFLFSVPPNTVIIKLEALLGNKRVLALIKEKEEAKQEYEQGIQDGKTMLYSEQIEEYPDVIKAKIGNLGPQETIKITYQYIEQLQVQVNEFWRLQIDPVVNPRYNQSQQNYLNNIFNIDKFSYDYVQDIKIMLNMELIYIKSPTHQLLIEYQDSGTLVGLNNEQQNNNQNQDPKNTFILIFQNYNIHAPLIQLTHTNNDQLQHQKYCATIQFIPQFNPLQLDDAYEAYQDSNDNESNNYEFNARGEYIFVLDRSGSMSGARINKAKQALSLFLQSLPVDSYYNIVSFGSQAQRHYEKSLKYNQKSLEQTLNEIAPIQADMGGTEIRHCLIKVVLSIERIQGYSRNIFILTDGEVDPEPVLEVVSENAKPDVRFYSLGIGNGCSQYMIEKIAFLGNGLHHIVADNEDLNKKVIDLLQDSITPYFQGFNFETNLPNQSLLVSNVININCIKKNTPLTVQILFKEDETEQNQSYFFKLTYYDENMKQYGLHTEIQLNKSIEDENYHKLAIGKQFQQILQNARLKQNEYKSIHAKEMNVTKQNIIDLSLSYQVLSPFTAFICEIVELNDDLKAKIKEKVTIKKQHQQQKYEYEDLPFQKWNLNCSYSGNIGSANIQPKSFSIQTMNIKKKMQSEQVNNVRFIGGGDIQRNSPSFSQPNSLPMQQPMSYMPQADIYSMQSESDLCVNDQKEFQVERKIVNQTQQIGFDRNSYLDIVNKFNLDGSIQDNNVINLLNLKKEDFKLAMRFDLQVLIAALAILEIKYKDDKDTWILVFNKGVKYLKQNNIMYKQVKNEIIQMLKLDQ